MFLESVPFPFPALVFMFAKGTIRYSVHGDCPYLAISRIRTGEEFAFSLPGMNSVSALGKTAVLVSTYLPGERVLFQNDFSSARREHQGRF
jgi:hypothetical protein